MHTRLNDPALVKQVQELLSSMDLAQKIGQMTQADRQTCTPQQASRYHLGSILSAAGSCPGENQCDDWVQTNEAYWQACMQLSGEKPKIPILYALDAIHGNNNVRGATIFPHNIGLGACHDPELIGRIARVTASEVMATGMDWALAPNFAVARDFHWGRTYESFSEDPHLVSSYAQPLITGLQELQQGEGILACAKHWVGDGGTSWGIDQGNTKLPWEALQQFHIFPYYEALRSGAMTVMASFSSWNGDKCHANHFLLTQVLKQQLGFAGFVVSDFQGIDYIADDFYLAVEKGVNAGIDMFMVPESWSDFIDTLHSHVELGTVSMERINDAVSRILSVKLACGLFDKPSPAQRAKANHKSFGSMMHREVAREAVRKSMVLLKNEKSLLPIRQDAKVLVTGKNAHNIGHQCGGFTIEWQGVSGNDVIEGGTSIWQGIQARCPQAHWVEDCTNDDLSQAHYDLAVVVIGETPYAEGLGDIRDGENLIVEAGSQIKGQLNVLEPYGHTLKYEELFPQDLAIIQTLREAKIPVVTLLVTGRPMLLDQVKHWSSSLVATWLPGSEGHGVAEVLFGEYDFHGKLPFTWPSRVHPPLHKGDKPYEPLYPFGFGLRYSSSPPERGKEIADGALK